MKCPSKPFSVINRARTSIHRWPIALIFGIVLLVYGSVLLGGKTLSSSAYSYGIYGDQVAETGGPHPANDGYRLDVGASTWQFEPWAHVTAEAYRKLDPPIWNQYQGLGAPLLGNMQSSALDPAMLPVFLSPTLLMWDLVMVGSILLSMLTMYFLAFRLMCGRTGSLVASTAFGLSGFFFAYNNNTFTRTYLYTPLLCLVTHIALNTKRSSRTLLIPTVVYLVIAVGMPESFALVFITTAAFGLWCALSRVSEIAVRRRLSRLILGYLGGALLSAPILLTFLEYERNSEHSHGSGGVSATLVDPPRLLLKLMSPFATGLPSSPLPGLSGSRGWLGVSVVLLAFIGLWARQAPWTLRLTLSLLAAFPIWKVFGLPFSEVLVHLPIFERINYPVWALPTTIFPTALLAGIGLKWLRANDGGVNRRLPIVAIGIVTTVFLVLIKRNWVEIRQVTDDRLVKGLGFSAGVALLAFAVLAWPSRGRSRSMAVAGLAIVELLVLAPIFIYQPRVEPFTKPSWLEAVQKQQEDTNLRRVFAFDGLLYPNTAATLGLRDIRMLDALYVHRTWKYIKTFIEPEIQTRFVGGAFAAEEFTTPWVERNPMWDALGIKTILSRRPLPGTAILGLSRDPSGLTNASVQGMTVNQKPETAIFFAPPGQVALPDGLLEAADKISFSYGLDDQAYRDPNADGVDFVVRQVGSQESETVELWRDSVIPVFEASNSGWKEVTVDVPPAFSPETSDLVISVEPRGNTSTDWAGVIDLRTDQPSLRTNAQSNFKLTNIINGTYIYDNPRATSGITVATKVLTAESSDDAVEIFKSLSQVRPDGSLEVESFDPSEAVVIERQDDLQLRRCTSSRAAVAKFTKVSSLEIKAQISSKCDGVAVFASAYFPGWKAEVNGRTAEVLPSNIALLGVPIAKGESQITLRYQPATFRLGVLFSFFTLAIMVALAVTCKRVEKRRMGQA